MERIGCRSLRGNFGFNNLTALATLVSSHLSARPWLVADNRFTYIHVRAGDGLQGPDCFNNVSDCLLESDWQYSKSRAYFETHPVRRAKWNNYVIVASTQHFHTADAWRQRRRYQSLYMREVIAYFQRLGPTVAMVNGDPDDDFALLTTAKFLRLTGGGFGRLAKSIRGLIYPP